MMKFFEYNCFKPSQHSFPDTKDQSGVWCPLFGDKPQPTQRSNHAVCVHDNQIFMYGGRGVKGTLNQFWIFNYDSSKWREVMPVGEAPPPLEGHSMVVFEEKIYVFGGETSFASADELPLWCFDIKNENWSKIGTNGKVMAPCGRRHHTAVLYMDAMCIYGGYQDLIGPTREMWLFDFETQSWHFDVAAACGTAPDARYGHSATVRNQAMWICGGLTGLKPNSDVFIWNFELMVWVSVKTKGGPSQMSGHSMCMVNNLMYVFGGRTASGESSNDMWSLSLSDNSWRKCFSDVKVKPPAISGHCLINFSTPTISRKQELRTRSLPNIKRKERSSHNKNSQPTKERSVSCGKLPNNSQIKNNEMELDNVILHSDKNTLLSQVRRPSEYAYDNPASDINDKEQTQKIESVSAWYSDKLSNSTAPALTRLYLHEDKSVKPKSYIASRMRYGNLQPRGNALNTFSYNLIEDSMHDGSANSKETSFIDIPSQKYDNSAIKSKNDHDTEFPDITTVKPLYSESNSKILDVELISLSDADKTDNFEGNTDFCLDLNDNSNDSAIMTQSSNSAHNDIAKRFQSKCNNKEGTILLVLGGRVANVNPNSSNPFCMWQCEL